MITISTFGFWVCLVTIAVLLGLAFLAGVLVSDRDTSRSISLHQARLDLIAEQMQEDLARSHRAARRDQELTESLRRTETRVSE